MSRNMPNNFRRNIIGAPCPTPVQFLAPSDFNVERVFPFSNLVNNGTETPTTGGARTAREDEGPQREPAKGPRDGDAMPSLMIHREQTSGGDSESKSALVEPDSTPSPSPNLSAPSDAVVEVASAPLVGTDNSAGDEKASGRWISERSRLVPSQSGAPGVLPGIVADRLKSTFTRCEDEPIHIPGAIQRFGALIALKYNEAGALEARICSENSLDILGYDPEQLFGLPSFLDIVRLEDRDDMTAIISHVLSNPILPGQNVHPDVLPVSIISPDKTQTSLWCAIHISPSSKGLIICEFEYYTEIFYDSDPNTAVNLRAEPYATIDMDVSPEELARSTSKSKPLGAIGVAKRRKNSRLSSMDTFNAMSQAQEQLASATSVQHLLDIVVGLISELTCFHRVMIYRFDEEKNGCVEAELLDPKASPDLFRGLYFPASDIPKQARDLYLKNRVRILHDRDAETARLVCRDITDFALPLDLTHSYLRAMSPIHIKYLRNMGVRSSMSVSIVINNDLWGLIACHTYGSVSIPVSLPVRALCRNIGDCAATNIERLLMIQRLESRRGPSSAPPAQSPSGFIAASSADLLRVFEADFGLLSIQDEARAIGRPDPYQEALVILAYLQARRFTKITSSQNINGDFPDIKYAPGLHTLSGILVIPLSIGGHDFLVFFRKGQIKEVTWAGNPHDKTLRPGGHYLEPRTSFKRWKETVAGRSKQWTEDQVETAAVLGLLYGRFIEIWRQKESSGHTSRLTRLLIHNSSHEVRTPLNAIVNYLEMALENKVDSSTQDLLEKAHKASRSLIYVIDDLLNLTKAEDGPVNSLGDTFDLGATVDDVTTAFHKEAVRKGLGLNVTTHQGIPGIVKGDAIRLHQVLSNITSNAFQHSVEGGIKVDIQLLSTNGDMSVVGITVQDVGIGMSESQLDSLFSEFEQVVDEASLSTDNSPSAGADTSTSLGVGLAVVARYVRNMGGQIRVHSELGKGTIFGIEIPFEHASPEETSSPIRSAGLSAPPHEPIRRPKIEGPLPNRSLKVSGSDTPHSQVPGLSITKPASNIDQPSMESTRPISDTLEIKIDPAICWNLNILIAEDNPINAKVLSKRLCKLGHEVHVAVDGQECHDHFSSKPDSVDVILMDIQMPLVDGIDSTKMIRCFERDSKEGLKSRPRVPIIAVSASLLEENRFEYLQIGFDGWVLKPIDVGRLGFLLRAIKDPQLRREAVYTPGKWEKGGWFMA